MREKRTEAEICLEGPGGFVYVLGLLRYIVRDDDSFRYELEPDYDVIDLLDASVFQGIPGFDLSKRKQCYVRDNVTPTLVGDRAPMPNREDLWQLLDECGMDHWNPVEWLIRTQKRYIGDDLFFRAASARKGLDVEVLATIEESANSQQGVASALRAICEGRDVLVKGENLSFSGMKVLYLTLLSLHEKMMRGKARESAGARPGRKRKPVDELMLNEAIVRYRAGEWTAKNAAESLDLSVPTFYRRMSEKGRSR